MRIKVRHDTVYTYDRPARSTVQTLRMTPRSFDGQFVRGWRVEIDVDARLDRAEDAFGNVTHTLFVDGPIERLKVTVEGEVDRSETHGVIRGTMERLPLGLYLRTTPLTKPTPETLALAQDLAAQGGDRLAVLHRTMTALRAQMRFEVGATATDTTAGEAFARRTGVCQDFAHVFIACVRSLGIPARYAGGYLRHANEERVAAGHAWAEAHVDEIGWIAFDVANGVCLTDQYVRVAIGLDYLDAAPVRGAQIGGGGEKLSVSVAVAQGQITQEE